MPQYYFFLGHTPDLSVLELRAIFPGEFKSFDQSIVVFQGELDESKFALLGGTRKVARSRGVVPRSNVEAKLVELIAAGTTKNIAVTDYANLNLSKSTIHDLKSMISRPIRLVSMDTNEHELVMLSHQHVTEYNLLPDGNDVNIAETCWIFDAEDWVRRDREKPYRDIKHGMLPPKIARLMVNLATGGKTGLTIADPFCGTGTVLSETILTGCSVVGSDTSPEAVEGARANLAWLVSTYDLRSTTYDLRVLDATHFASRIDAIVTEPYMGPLLDDRNPLPLSKIKNIAKGLDKLYRGAFKSWSQVLPPGGRVVMTIPSFAVYNRVIPTIGVDALTALGYNCISSVAYGKPGAIVIRNITILEKK
jgi:tRNA G10  N-methylase Trm11